MKILIVTQYYYPEQFQINEIAPELVKRGHQVTVLTGLPNYPKGEIYEGYKDKWEEEKDGVDIIRVNIHPRKQNPLNLLWNYVSFIIYGNKKAKRLKDHFDIIFAYQLSPVTSLYPAVTFKKKHKTPVLNYCLDIWPESAKAQVGSKTFLFRYIRKVSRNLYQHCDHIAVTSRPFIDYLLAENRIPLNRMSYLPQHADETYLSLNLTSPENGVVDFLYAGNLGKGQRVDIIIKAAAEIHKQGFMVHIIGDGSTKSDLEKLVKDLEIEDKVVFHGNQKREDMPSFYRQADALLITLRGDNYVGNTMPGKLQTYMACAKPILGAINGSAAEVIQEANCGKCVAAEDYSGLARLMTEYIEHPEYYSCCGKNAAKYFEDHFTLKHYCDKLEDLMEKMI